MRFNVPGSKMVEEFCPKTLQSSSLQSLKHHLLTQWPLLVAYLLRESFHLMKTNKEHEKKADRKTKQKMWGKKSNKMEMAFNDIIKCCIIHKFLFTVVFTHTNAHKHFTVHIIGNNRPWFRIVSVYSAWLSIDASHYGNGSLCGLLLLFGL